MLGVCRVSLTHRSVVTAWQEENHVPGMPGHSSDGRGGSSKPWSHGPQWDMEDTG